MSRQLEQQVEERQKKRSNALVSALEYGIVGAMESQGIELLGIAFKFDAYNCLMTLKADVAGVRSVAFVGSDTMASCILKCVKEGRNNELHWRKDKYHTSGD